MLESYEGRDVEVGDLRYPVRDASVVRKYSVWVLDSQPSNTINVVAELSGGK